MTRAPAHEEEIGDVRARQQQHEADRARQQDDRATEIAEDRAVEWLQGNRRPVPLLDRILLGQPMLDRLHGGDAARGIDARREPYDGAAVDVQPTQTELRM